MNEDITSPAAGSLPESGGAPAAPGGNGAPGGPRAGSAASTRAREGSSGPPPASGNGDGRGQTPAIEFRHLHRHFGRLKAVNDISFKAYPGQVMGFIGPNGAGKTTAMRILATLDVPTSGDAFINGYSVVDDPDKVRTIVGFMPDSFGKYGNMNVVEYVDFFARAYGLSGAPRRDAVERVLVFTELRKLAEKPITTLSKGMSQRLALGRTLINDPSVLILDEPAAGLDPRARIELRELIRLLALDLQKTVLISSHILTELGEICDSAAIIEAGRILASGTIEEISQAQRVSRGTVQGVAMFVRALNDGEMLERVLLQQPFCESVACAGPSASFQFTGDERAQHALLRQLLMEGLEIVEFRGRTETLEDAFMAITKGITQ
jgi:ABC-2 type transport system ATP-binding protein